MLAPVRQRPRATSVPMSLPVPLGGQNLIAPAGQMPPTDAYSQINLVQSDNGLRARLGHTEWVTGITGAADNLVRSTLSFAGSTQSGTKDRLYATSSSGIWTATTSTGAPAHPIVFGTQTGDAGYGSGTTVVTAAGHFYLYCDEVNGYHVYTESTDSWAKITLGGGATQVSGVDPANLAYVMAWQGRVWFIEKDSARAWYLTAGAIYGAATEFDFGNLFRSGGPLMCLGNWTGDGGSGLDDRLVAISGGGDVVVYEGTDPASSLTFQIKGVWRVGAMPAGRQLTSQFGGDLLILTRRGILPLSKLVTGSPAGLASIYATEKIGPAFNGIPSATWGYKGWSIRLHPEDNSIIVTVPTGIGLATNQWAMSLSNGSWGQYRDLPLYSAEPWEGKLYFGTTDGRVCINTGYLDGVTLADANAYKPVQFQLITGFQNFGSGRQKRVHMIRPTFFCDGGVPTYRVEARYRYDASDMASVTPGAAGAGTWDTAKWDVDVWSGAFATTQAVTGAVGMGPEFAIAVRGAAKARTVLAGFDLLIEQGGFL